MIPETVGDCVSAAVVTGEKMTGAGTGERAETAGIEERMAAAGTGKKTEAAGIEERMAVAGTGKKTEAVEMEERTIAGMTSGRMTAPGTEEKIATARTATVGKAVAVKTDPLSLTVKAADGAAMAGLPESGMCVVMEACVRVDGRNLAVDPLRRNADRMSEGGAAARRRK